MFHEMTYEELRARRWRRVITALVCLALCAAVALAVVWGSSVARHQAVNSVRESVITASMQCAAVEGSYPSSIEHLEKYYGLVIDHDHYMVYYEWLGDNVPPTVTVVAL